MNRRAFVAVGASAAAVATRAAALVMKPGSPGKGEQVTLAGWVEPARGSGHAFVFSGRAGVNGASESGLGADDLVLVYPRDARAMRSGPARLEGRLFRGRFRDGVTGHTARTVLTEARLV